jgi:hypothetical protein
MIRISIKFSIVCQYNILTLQPGWDIPTLTASIDQCLTSNDGYVILYSVKVKGAYKHSRVIQDCPPLSASDNPNFATLCPETSPISPCEPVHGMVEKLPGCITPTGENVVVVPADNTW